MFSIMLLPLYNVQVVSVPILSPTSLSSITVGGDGGQKFYVGVTVVLIVLITIADTWHSSGSAAAF